MIVRAGGTIWLNPFGTVLFTEMGDMHEVPMSSICLCWVLGWGLC